MLLSLNYDFEDWRVRRGGVDILDTMRSSVLTMLRRNEGGVEGVGECMGDLQC